MSNHRYPQKQLPWAVHHLPIILSVPLNQSAPRHIGNISGNSGNAARLFTVIRAAAAPTRSLKRSARTSKISPSPRNRSGNKIGNSGNDSGNIAGNDSGNIAVE